MDRAFTLPQNVSQRAQMFYSYWKEKVQPNRWQTKIDRLADKKISWSQFFEEPLSESHPALALTTTKNGDTLLHIAIAQGEDEWTMRLSSYSSMLNKPNHYGFYPFELCKLLGKKPSNPQSLFSVPNLSIEEPEKAKLLHFDYLDEPIFHSQAELELILEKTAKAKARDQIPAEKIWMGIYFYKEIQKGLAPKLSLRWIDEQLGFGIFSAQRIPSCSFIGEYTGYVKEGLKKTLKDNFYSVRYTTWDTGRKKFVIDAEKAGNFTRFINHSSKPNLGLQSIYWRGLPRMVLISLQEIEEGAQLTFDYGNLFWKECPLPQIPIK